MSDRTLTAIEFEVPGEKYSPEAINHPSVPREGEEIEIGARFKDGERADPDLVEFREWDSAEYRVVLRGNVEKVTRHYHRALDRSELSVGVQLSFDEESHGYEPNGME